MSEIILIILMFVFAGIAAVLISKRGREKFVGICEAAIESKSKKEERKEKILVLLSERGGLSNAELREKLSVSATSVVRYMDELERDGKVEQVGDKGHAVSYKLR
jgi:predicted HTH transcriptional regulator